MESGLSGLYKLKKDRVTTVAAMMAKAFNEYPLMVWFYPDDKERLIKTTKVFESLVRFHITYGEIYSISPALEAAAIWVYSTKSNMNIWKNIRSGNYSVIWKSWQKEPPRRKAYKDYATAVHRRCAPFPHVYLRILAVDPEYRDRGLSGRLLRPMFQRIDKEGLPCYLETQAERNVAIYEHFGFKVVEEGIIPGGDVRSWGMLRKTG